MEKIVEDSLISLKEAIDSDARLLKLNELEQKLEENEEVIILAKRKDEAVNAYETALKVYPSTSKEVGKAQKLLYESKKNLDAHPLVKEYNEAYIAVADLYLALDDVIFSPFRQKVLHLGENDD